MYAGRAALCWRWLNRIMAGALIIRIRWQRLGGLQTEAIRKQGADPQTGRKLGWMFAQAGLSEIEVGVLGGQWRVDLSENEWELEWQVLRQDLGDILSEAAWQAVEEDGRNAYQSGSRILYVPTFYAWGRM